MKRLFLILLCLHLTGCAYFGATEDILISSPDDIEISQFPTSTPTITTPDSNPPSESETTGTSMPEITPSTTAPIINHLILNTSSKKIHYFDNCSYANRMDPKNKKIVDTSAEKSLLAEEYTVCSWCANKKN